ncbi:MAG: N-acetyl-D-Glu racemase DgcA [Pseudomonadota bacterium]
MTRLTVRAERWPLPAPFVIARMRMEAAEVVVVEIERDDHIGRGEADRIEDVLAGRTAVLDAIEEARPAIEAGADRAALQDLLPAGPARSALDCALWDLEAKVTGAPVWRLAGLDAPLRPLTTVFTLGLDTPEAMAKAARAANRPILKLKLGGEGDLERVAAVREAAPEARLSVDANTGWSDAHMAAYPEPLAALGVELIEQPFPPGEDHRLDGIASPIPLAADESCLDRNSLSALEGRYKYINIKIDKAGGLTEALALAKAARAKGFSIMVGCNVATSLSMAPGVVLGQLARFVDLDGPLLLARDRSPSLAYDGATLHPPDPTLWG